MKQRELEDAIKDEVAEWPGVSVEFIAGGKHPKAKLTFGELMLSRPYAGTPSDSRYGLHKCLGDMRRVMKQLGAERAKPEPSEEEIERRYSKPNDGAEKRPDPVQGEKADPQPDIADQLVDVGVVSPEQAKVAAEAKPVLSGHVARHLESTRPDLTILKRVEHDPTVARSGWGLYHDIEAVDYHLDPCPEPAISNSLMEPILTKTAKDFAFAHPRRHELLPGVEWDDDIRKDTLARVRGDVVHQLALGKGRGYAVGDFPTWQSKDSKAFKEDAEAAGLTPIKRKDFEEAEMLADRVREAIKRALDGAAYETEVVFMYQEQTEHGPIWVRGMMDIWCEERAIILDPKVTSRLYDGLVERHALAMGWDRQGALYQRAIGQIFPEIAGRVEFCDLMINPDPPYVSRLWAPERHWLASSVRQCQIAFERFGECMFRKEWPDFGNSASRGPMPVWEDKRRTEMEIGA